MNKTDINKTDINSLFAVHTKNPAWQCTSASGGEIYSIILKNGKMRRYKSFYNVNSFHDIKTSECHFPSHVPLPPEPAE